MDPDQSWPFSEGDSRGVPESANALVLRLVAERFESANIPVSADELVLRLVTERLDDARFKTELVRTIKEHADSSAAREDEVPVTFQPGSRRPWMHKTRLCKTYTELGFCSYGNDCYFAHGQNDLRPLRIPDFKLLKCRFFDAYGICPSGERCGYIHNETEEELQELRKKMWGGVEPPTVLRPPSTSDEPGPSGHSADRLPPWSRRATPKQRHEEEHREPAEELLNEPEEHRDKLAEEHRDEPTEERHKELAEEHHEEVAEEHHEEVAEEHHEEVAEEAEEHHDELAEEHHDELAGEAEHHHDELAEEAEEHHNELAEELSERLERHHSCGLNIKKTSTELPSATVDEEAATEPPTPAFEAVQEPAAPEAEKEKAVHDKKVAAEKLILGASKFVASGDVDQALELLRRSIALHPTSPAYCLISFAYVRQKRYPDAYKAALEGLQLDPNDLNALKMQARCLYLTGLYSRARPILRRVLDAEPDNESIIKVAKEVERKADNPNPDALFLGL